MVIENAKQTLERSSAHSSKYNNKWRKFNYCPKLNAYFGNVIIAFLILISLTFGKTQVMSWSTPHHWLSSAELITWNPLGHQQVAINSGEIERST